MLSIKIPNKKDIDAILFDPEIYERITDDYTNGQDIQVPYDDWYFLGAYIDGKIVGLFYVHDDNWMHFAVLKEYRRYAGEILKECLKLYPYKVYVTIPTKFRNVINFAKKNGFKESAVLAKHYLKNGVFYDSIKLIYEA